MSDYRIESTSEADAHAREIDSWWRDHRPASPDLFLNELTRSFMLPTRMPTLGATYDDPGSPANVRCLLMRSTWTHIYRSVDAAARVVVVRAIWHASRGPGPFGTR